MTTAIGKAEPAAGVDAGQDVRPRVSLIIPAYNEEEGVGTVVRGVRGAMAGAGWTECEIIVVDDGSEDCTSEEAAKAEAKVIRRRQNGGYGAALKTGIRHASGEIIVITDADGTYPAEDIPRLLEQMAHCDMVVGARVGDKVKIPLARRPAKRVLNWLANYLAETRIPDLNSGLRAFKRETVLKFLPLLPNGFSFTTTITLAMLCNDYEVVYVPIDYRQRTGRSKIRPFQDTYNFVMLIVRTVSYFNPLKIFLPLALAIFAATVAKITWDSVNSGQPDITQGAVMLGLGGLQMAALGLIADIAARSRLGHDVK